MKSQCFDETLYAMYVDNEINAIQREQIDAHLKDCSTCRKQILSLKSENEQLKNTFLSPMDIPDLTPKILEKLDQSPLIKINRYHISHPFRWGFAAAASILAIIFIYLFLLSSFHSNELNGATEKEVILCSASLEGKQTQSHVYEDKSQDTQYIWLEKENDKENKSISK